MRARLNDEADEKAKDKELIGILYKGANLLQLAALFRIDHRTLVRKLAEGNCEPAGVRSGRDIYEIHEVAPFLIKPAYDIEKYVKRMHPSELPKMLTKEFWAAMKSRQDFELKEGDLWPTVDVIERVGNLLKIVKNNVRIAEDAVERQVELTPAQRKIIKDLMANLLEECRSEAVEKFSPKAKTEAEDADDEM